jgi:hypothetical protein
VKPLAGLSTILNTAGFQGRIVYTGDDLRSSDSVVHRVGDLYLANCRECRWKVQVGQSQGHQMVELLWNPHKTKIRYMQTAFSQRRFVTVSFWEKVKALEFDADLSKALLKFDKSMIIQDKTESRGLEDPIIGLLGVKYSTIKDNMVKSPVNEIFNMIALTVAGTVLASLPKQITGHDIRKEIAVYFGVTGAKGLLGLTRTPNGFKSGRMFQALCRYYKMACSVQIHVGEKPRPLKGLKVSDEIKSYFRQSSIQWVKDRSRVWTNDARPLDSRTQEFDAFVSFLLSTPFRDENVIVHINQLWPSDPKDAIPKSFKRDPGTNETCISVIKNSPWCLEVEGFLPHTIYAKFGPVKDALPFILKTLTDPAQHLHESGIPRGCYTFTFWLLFEDWHIHINTFRC